MLSNSGTTVACFLSIRNLVKSKSFRVHSGPGTPCNQLQPIKSCVLVISYCTQLNCVQYKSHRNRNRETTMSVNVLYKTSAKATGGRDGHAATLDGALAVKLTTPKELGGGGGAVNHPPQLFPARHHTSLIL